MKSHFFFSNTEKFTRTETYPLVDLLLTSDEVFIMAEVPGIPKDSLEVKINKDYVEIAGVRKEPDFFTRATHFYKLETYYGCFRRRFTLPVEIDTQKAKIVLIDGILTISIPRLKKRVIQIPVE